MACSYHGDKNIFNIRFMSPGSYKLGQGYKQLESV